jgi:hypothetical protein
MDKRTFQSAVFDLSIYFERKPPSDATVSQWFEEIAHIPNSHIQEICGDVKRLESWPRNLPAFMVRKSSELSETKGENNQYAIHPRRLHPHLYAKATCPQCKGKGLIPWPMDWPMYRDETGKVVTRKFTPNALCPCTDDAEYGF